MKRSLRTIGIMPAAALAIAALGIWAARELFSDKFDRANAAYLTGKYSQALEQLRPLADAGDSRAQLVMGLIYEHGEGVAVDFGRALTWYGKAANQGNAEAQAFIGIMHALG